MIQTNLNMPMTYFKPKECTCGASNFLSTDMDDGSYLIWCQDCNNLVLVIPIEDVVLIEEEF